MFSTGIKSPGWVTIAMIKHSIKMPPNTHRPSRLNQTTCLVSFLSFIKVSVPWQPAWQVLIHGHTTVFHDVSQIIACDNHTEQKNKTAITKDKNPLSKEDISKVQIRTLRTTKLKWKADRQRCLPTLLINPTLSTWIASKALPRMRINRRFLTSIMKSSTGSLRITLQKMRLCLSGELEQVCIPIITKLYEILKHTRKKLFRCFPGAKIFHLDLLLMNSSLKRVVKPIITQKPCIILL